MTRCLLALALCFTAACGDPTCEEAVNHAAKMLGGVGYGGSGDRARGIAQCKEDRWSVTARNCIVSARNLLELRECRRHLEK